MAKLIDLIVSGKSSFANDISAKTIYSTRLYMSGAISTCNTPGTWVSGMANAAIRYNDNAAISTSSYHPFLSMKASGGHVVNFGGLGDTIGFYGYYNGRTANSYDWSFTVNSSTGKWSMSNSITASAFITSGGANTQVVRGDGTLQTISSLSVSYANSAGNADTVDGHHLYTRNLGVNGTSWTFASTANANATTHIYAPTAAGTSGQILKSTGGTPTWINQSDISAGSATKDSAGNTISSYYLPLSGGIMSGPIRSDSGYVILNPIGASYHTTTGTVTGCITINLPASLGNTMVSMWIDVYIYEQQKSFSVHCGGYTYSNSTWQHSPFAIVYGANHRVRLGHNGTQFVVYIGETNTVWSYPQVSVRNVTLGYSPTLANWAKTWSVSFSTSVSNVTYDTTTYAWTTKNLSKSEFAAASHRHTKLHRRDDNSDYSLQHHWTGSYWYLRGYSGDSFHAEVQVGYANSAGSVAWGNVTGKPINFKAYSGSLSSGGWKTMQGNNSSPSIAISYNNSAAAWNSGTFSATLVYGCSDTRGLLDCAYNTPIVTFGGCSYGGSNDNNPTWYMKLSGTHGVTYNLNSMPYASSAGYASTVAVNDSNSNSTYRMVWHSDNTLYSTDGIYCNPSTDVLNAKAYTLNGASSAGTNYITGTAGRIFFGGNFHIDSLGSNATYINHYTANNVYLVSGSSQGKVGIGTASPSQKLHVSGGIIQVNANSRYLQIGPQNSGWSHFQSDVRFYFNQSLHVDGDIYLYNTSVRMKKSNGYVYASGFYHNSYASSAYALTSDGGAAHIGSMSVNYANSAGNADTVDGLHSNRFTFVYNSTNYNNNSSLTVNQMAADGNSNSHVGMIYAGTDNPVSSSGNWVHVWSQSWSRGSISSWCSQIALGVQQGTGMWYRTTSGALAGKAWNRVLDSANYTSYVNNYYWANVKISTSSNSATYPTFANMKSTGRVYLDEWIQFSGSTGLYWPNANGAHLYANTTTSYAGLITQGSRGGYCGLQCGPGTTYMTVMSTDTHHGLYCENTGTWEFYYNRGNGGVGIRTSSITKNFNVSGQSYLSSNVWIGTTSGGEMLNVGGGIKTENYITFGTYGARFDSDIRNSWRTNIYGNTTNESRLKTVRTDANINNFSEIYGSGLTWATGDTQGYLGVSYSSGKAWIGGGSGNVLHWSTYLVTGNNIGSQSVSYASSSPAAANYGGRGDTTKIKIKINSAASWMLSFVVTIYQGYKSSKVMVSGYNYGSNYWLNVKAVLLGDSNGATSIPVYFGYDSTWNLWVGFDGGSYTGVSISDVTNGYTQISSYKDLFTISNVSSLSTLQTTVTAVNSVNYAISSGNADTVDSLHASAFMRAASAGSYYGIQHPDGSTSRWTRTTSSGIIPYTSGGASNLGTSSWPFSTVYANNFYGYLNGTISGNASTVTVNSSDANSTYRMVWHSGNTLYGTGGIYCNPSSDYLYATSVQTSDWFRSTGNSGWYSQTYGGGWYMNDTTYIRVYNSKRVYNGNTSQYAFYTAGGMTVLGHMYSNSSACSWIAGQNATNAALNIGDATDTGSYWPWFRQTNTSSKKWFSVGTLNNSLYFIGSATSRTANSYDYGFRMDFSNGYLYGNFSGYLSGRAAEVTVNNSDSNSTYRMVWHSGNTLYSTAGIYCNPSTDALYASAFYETSDIRFKKNVKQLFTFNNIPQIKEFDWKNSGKHSYGLIAQELESMGYSELVDTKDDGYKSVNYTAALCLIIGKLQLKIKELEDKIKSSSI